ncbi:MAG: hypothetical protein IJG54_03720 [Bacteroidales bacterium]|nr:hypothetical protein [Bacteroidales bacterium]
MTSPFRRPMHGTSSGKERRKAIPYRGSKGLNTDNAKVEHIRGAVRKIYKDYPDVIKILEEKGL